MAVSQEYADALREAEKLTQTVERLRQKLDRYRKALREVQQYAKGHHADEDSCVWLHSLTVDIPHMIEADLAGGFSMSETASAAAPVDRLVMPRRVQRKRVKGWRMPANTVSVCRPGKFGNPFKPAECREAGYTGSDLEIKQRCVEAFRAWLVDPDGWLNWQGDEADRRKAEILEGLQSLRGKNLACFCKLDEPCHADVLLELANSSA